MRTAETKQREEGTNIMRHIGNRDLLWILLCVSTLSVAANAQSNIDANHKFAWGENIGWTNWQHDRPSPGDGVLVNETFLSGFVWAENLGWINLGYGTPTNGVHYANTDDSDFGVNLDPDTGDLFGLGWGENVGWLNFDTRDKGDQRARIDCTEERFYGYIWGENVGWINLDDSVHYVSGAFEDACVPLAPPSLPFDLIHQSPKNRYISLDLSTNGNNSVAYKVTLSEMYRCSGDTRRACVPSAPSGDPDACPGICSGDSNLQCSNDGQCGGAGPCVPSGPCVEHSNVGSSWYVGTPYTRTAVPNNDLVDQHLANLVSAPVFRVWTETTIHVTACEVVPVAGYDVVAVDQNSGAESDALTIATIGKPLGTHYGDVVGIVSDGVFTPPQGVVSVTDVSAYLIANQGGAPGTAPPHTTWVDLHGTEWSESCAGDNCTIPQAILSVSDLGRIKFGFLGKTYSETPGQEDPGNCP